jgi:hypothetical protein
MDLSLLPPPTSLRRILRRQVDPDRTIVVSADYRISEVNLHIRLLSHEDQAASDQRLMALARWQSAAGSKFSPSGCVSVSRQSRGVQTSGTGGRIPVWIPFGKRRQSSPRLLAMNVPSNDSGPRFSLGPPVPALSARHGGPDDCPHGQVAGAAGLRRLFGLDVAAVGAGKLSCHADRACSCASVPFTVMPSPSRCRANETAP